MIVIVTLAPRARVLVRFPVGVILKLARRGLNVAILSRSRDKLNLVASTISESRDRDDQDLDL